jgi:hypothetical protein
LPFQPRLRVHASGTGSAGHDERDGLAVERGRLRDVRRTGGVRLEVAVQREVDVIHARLDRAGLVQRRSERLTRGEREVLGLAEERLLVRARDDRPLDGVARHFERRGRPARKARLDGVRALAQPVDETHEPVAARGLPERGSHVAAVRHDLETRRVQLDTQLDGEQDVPARHEPGTRREALDA